MPRTATLVIAVTILLGVANSAQETVSKGRDILAMGRRLPYVYAVSLDAALNPANGRTSKAIVARGKVATEGLDGRLLGDPANLVVSEDRRTVYVVNHGASRQPPTSGTSSSPMAGASRMDPRATRSP